jgi:hypothetical protein
MDNSHSTKGAFHKKEDKRIFFSRAAKYFVSPDAKATDLYDDATLLLGLMPDMIYNIRSGLETENGELKTDSEVLVKMLYALECLCEQVQGSLSGISYNDFVNKDRTKPSQ